ncbi:hypothetical protein [Kineosporia sp. A_224]|uniref:hypothetical protein n=1 Tax=Kineosporia sp. A_224 TaxID=1962180 RepID=UPI000B4BC43B|nr:hypothetical protein [Kineosporia sp. A_224]
MTDAADAPDVHALLKLLELTDILFYEVSARRTSASEDIIGDVDGVNIEVKVGSDEQRVEVRLVGNCDIPTATLRVDVACLFQSETPFTAADSTIREFAEKVGVMAAYPYLREALTEAAVKIRVPAPVMALIRPGQVSLKS